MHFKHSSWRQIYHIIAFFTISFSFLYASGYLYNEDLDPLDDYGLSLTCILYALKIIVLLALGPNLFILYGTIFYNEPPPKTFHPPSKCISFRFVTRGDFPDLVQENVNMLIALLDQLDLTNYLIEVVCNKAVHLLPRPKVREIVVPVDYCPPNGAKYKARNLHYAIEDDVNQLKDDDWIVHLDEESQLTKEAIIGIVNFINRNKHHIGQGLITYGKARIANITNTLAECYRCAVYIGASRFSLKALHRPLYSFCGSFIVCTKGVEKRVSFDNGIKGSIAEDAYFALKASNMGYTFDWIEGELYEEASFTFMDLVHQRKRWVQGLWLVHHSKEIKCDMSSFFFKLFHYASLLLPLQFAGDIILTLFPISFFKVDQILAHLNGLVLYYLLFVGLSYSFELPKLGWIRRICYCLSIVFVKRYWLFAESCAVVWAFLSNRDEFYVIKKQL